MTRGDREVVVALAGHVDHGKSALAHALTGQDTDRRRTEQQRGLTVDLGHLVLTALDHAIALTDVPGHVDYLGNTLVGLAGATHALLVVAADDGWMPQTEDHVRAATWLGTPVAVVAVTKADAVGDDRVAAVVADVRDRLTALRAPVAPVVPVSAVDGRGVDEVARVLAGLTPPPSAGRAPRLWIDRAFRVGGRGLVVAGSLTHGRVAVGDRVAVGPVGAVGRVRGLQQHGHEVEAADAPTRVAVDLVDANAARGDRLLAGDLRGHVPATVTIDTWVASRHDPGIGPRGAWILHVGSTHVEVEVRPLADDVVADGADGAVRLRLARALPLVHGDRFVLRDVGRRVVAGGGVVLDPQPPPGGRGRAARTARARVLGDLHAATDSALGLVEADGGATPVTRVATAVGIPDVDVDRRADHAVSPAWLDRLAEVVTDRVTAAGPDGAPVDSVVADTRALLAVPADVVRAALDGVAGVTRRDIRLVAMARREDHDRARSGAMTALHERLRAHPLDPPVLAEAAAAAGVGPADLDRLVRRGAILVSGDHGFLPAAVPLAVARLRDLEASTGPFTVAQARDVLGVTRRHAVPWMELLDRLGVTVREGDRRRLSPSAGSGPPGPPRTPR